MIEWAARSRVTGNILVHRNQEEGARRLVNLNPDRWELLCRAVGDWAPPREDGCTRELCQARQGEVCTAMYGEVVCHGPVRVSVD